METFWSLLAWTALFYGICVVVMTAYYVVWTDRVHLGSVWAAIRWPSDVIQRIVTAREK